MWMQRKLNWRLSESNALKYVGTHLYEKPRRLWHRKQSFTLLSCFVNLRMLTSTNFCERTIQPCRNLSRTKITLNTFSPSFLYVCVCVCASQIINWYISNFQFFYSINFSESMKHLVILNENKYSPEYKKL